MSVNIIKGDPEGNKVHVLQKGTATITIPTGFASGTYTATVSKDSGLKFVQIIGTVVPPYATLTDKYSLPIPAVSINPSTSVFGFQAYATLGIDYVDLNLDVNAASAGAATFKGNWVFTYELLGERLQ